MANVLQDYRISDREISNTGLADRINETNATTKRLYSAVSSALSKLDVQYDHHTVESILKEISFLNLRFDMNDYDKVYSFGFTHDINSDIEVSMMQVGRDRVLVIKNKNTEESVQDKSELSKYTTAWDELALDIYKGCPMFDPALCVDYMNAAVRVINEAYNGVTYRRDIFTCETLGVKFIPFGVLSLGAQSNKVIKYIPYITGMMIKDDWVQPLIIELSLARVCKNYHNEFIFDDGKCLDLANAKNLAMLLIQPDIPEGFKRDLYKSVYRLTRAKVEKLKTASFDAFRCLEDEFDKVVWVDDEMRMLAEKLSVPQFVTK